MQVVETVASKGSKLCNFFFFFSSDVRTIKYDQTQFTQFILVYLSHSVPSWFHLQGVKPERKEVNKCCQMQSYASRSWLIAAFGVSLLIS